MKTRSAVYGLFLVFVSVGLSAQERPNTMFLEELTWTEVREAIDNGTTTIIVPTAGTEQNGPHMVLGKHKFIINHTSDLIARELGNALVAPVVTYVPEGSVENIGGHMRYAGTITLPNEYFMKLLEYAARSLAIHGFTDIVFIGDSGGNQGGMRDVAAMLNEEWAGEPARVHFVGDYYSAARTEFREWLMEEHGETDETIGGHARDQRHVAAPLRRAPAHPRGPAGSPRWWRRQRGLGRSHEGIVRAGPEGDRGQG